MTWYSARDPNPEETKEYKDEFFQWLDKSYISQEDYAQLTNFQMWSLQIAFEDGLRTFNRRGMYKLLPLSQTEEAIWRQRLILDAATT